MSQLKQELDRLLVELRPRREFDAIAPVLKFKKSEDIEIAGFIASVLAYGRVEQIIKSTTKALGALGPHPKQSLVSGDFGRLRAELEGWKHRFNSFDDLMFLFEGLRLILDQYGSLESAFVPSRGLTAYEVIGHIRRVFEGVLKGGKPGPARSFWYLISDPSKGSCCKRLNLFLRWMVGVSYFDFGIWKSMETRNLVIPLDTHVLKQSKLLKLTERNTADWKTAEEITDKLKKLDPLDPTRFDFAICHWGMLEFRSKAHL